MNGFNACHLIGYGEINYIKSETLMLSIVVMVKKYLLSSLLFSTLDGASFSSILFVFVFIPKTGQNGYIFKYIHKFLFLGQTLNSLRTYLL